MASYDAHVVGHKHKSQIQSSQIKSGDEVATGEVKIAQFGKAFPLCPHCKKSGPSPFAHVIEGP